MNRRNSCHDESCDLQLRKRKLRNPQYSSERSSHPPIPSGCSIGRYQRECDRYPIFDRDEFVVIWSPPASQPDVVIYALFFPGRLISHDAKPDFSGSIRSCTKADPISSESPDQYIGEEYLHAFIRRICIGCRTARPMSDDRSGIPVRIQPLQMLRNDGSWISHEK